MTWLIRAMRNANQAVIGYEVGYYYPVNDTNRMGLVVSWGWERLWAHYNSEHSNDPDKAIKAAMHNIHYLNGGN